MGGMSDGNVVGPASRGAGVYGTPAPSHVTRCVNSRNPHGHNRECPCGWWAREQAGSVYGEPVTVFPPSRHRWWDPDAEGEASRERDRVHREAEMDRQNGWDQ